MGQQTPNARSASRSPGSRRVGLLLTAAALIALAAPAAVEAKKKGKGGQKVTVMTRNVYLGADLTPALEAASLGEAIDATGTILNEVDSTDFPQRAKPLAREIRKAKPHLVGLQEVALWRQQTPSDLPPEFGGTAATEVRYDFLELLLDRLNRRGGGKGKAAGSGNKGKGNKGKGNKKGGPKYRVVHVQEEFDQELPVDADGSDATGGVFGADLDGRLTMRDVILARKGGKLKLGKTDSAHYETLFEADVGGIALDVERGWQSVVAKVKGRSGGKGKKAAASRTKGSRKFLFVNTHLEAFGSPTIREAQAEELVADPLDTKKQVILVGDINSGLQKRHAVDGYMFDPGDPLAFKALKGAGFKDNGAKKPNKSYQQTCCYSDLFDASLTFDHTVDHVLTNPGLRTKRAFATGDDRSERISGLWPSDHGGKVSRVQLKKK